MTLSKAAMLGLGIMGGGMARCLVAAGYDVSVWNRSADKAAALAALGATPAPTPADAARDADVVIAMVADDDASRHVWLDERGGALAAMRDGAVAIESSTLTLGWVRTLSRAASARGIAFLDAPVTGSRQQASEGKLKFLVGGDGDALERVRPVLAAMSVDTAHLGPVGSGAVLKLINNFLCGVQVASVAEAVAMIEASGLDPRRAVDLLANGAPGSPLLGAVSKRMLDRDFDPQFLVPLMAKDLAYATAAFAEVGILLASAAAAKNRFDTAIEDGRGDSDIAAIVESLRSQVKRAASIGGDKVPAD